MSTEPEYVFWEWLCCCFQRDGDVRSIDGEGQRLRGSQSTDNWSGKSDSEGDVSPRSRGSTGPKQRPTHFVSMRVDTPQIIENIGNMQNDLKSRIKESSGTCIGLGRMHITVLLTRLMPDQIPTFQLCLRRAAEALRTKFSENSLKVPFAGMGQFEGKVLFCSPTAKGLENLRILQNAIKEEVVKARLPYMVEKTWIEPGEAPTKEVFTPHLTIAKTSQLKGLARKKNRKLKLSVNKEFENQQIGTQVVNTLDLCDMKADDDYYLVLETYLISTPMANAMVGGSNKWPTTHIRQIDGKIGLTMLPTQVGLLIETIQESPGQPELNENDVLVAIDNMPLEGLDSAKAVQHLFDSRLRHGVSVSVARDGELDITYFPDTSESRKKKSQKGGKKGARNSAAVAELKSNDEGYDATESTNDAGGKNRSSVSTPRWVAKTSVTGTPRTSEGKGGSGGKKSSKSTPSVSPRASKGKGSQIWTEKKLESKLSVLVVPDSYKSTTRRESAQQKGYQNDGGQDNSGQETSSKPNKKRKGKN